MKTNNAIHKGFTLVELMISITIIGILVAIAIPNVQNYIKRAQVVEGYSLTAGFKSAVVETLYATGKCPDNWKSASSGIPFNLDIKGKYVDRVTVSRWDGDFLGHDYACQITAYFNPKFFGTSTDVARITLRMITPETVGGPDDPALKDSTSVLWQCSGYLIPLSYLPTACQLARWTQ